MDLWEKELKNILWSNVKQYLPFENSNDIQLHVNLIPSTLSIGKARVYKCDLEYIRKGKKNHRRIIAKCFNSTSGRRFRDYDLDMYLSKIGQVTCKNQRLSDVKPGEKEWKVLNYLWELGVDDGYNYRIPRPIDYLSSIDTCLIEWIEGNNFLSEIILGRLPLIKRVRGKAIEKQIEKTAIWLIRFQKLTFKNEWIRITKETRIARHLLRHIECLNHGVTSEIFDVLEKIGNIPEKCPVTGCHGDFVVRNELVNNHSTAFIDWSNFIFAHPYFDLHHFLTNIRVWPAWFFCSEQTSNHLRNIFLRTYWQRHEIPLSRRQFFRTKLLYLIFYLGYFVKAQFIWNPFMHPLILKRVQSIVTKELLGTHKKLACMYAQE